MYLCGLWCPMYPMLWSLLVNVTCGLKGCTGPVRVVRRLDQIFHWVIQGFYSCLIIVSFVYPGFFEPGPPAAVWVTQAGEAHAAGLEAVGGRGRTRWSGSGDRAGRGECGGVSTWRWKAGRQLIMPFKEPASPSGRRGQILPRPRQDKSPIPRLS